MDSITQGALGAAIGSITLGKENAVKGAFTGAIIATVPDLDVLFYAFFDSYEMLNIHRGFSHSIIFSFLASILIAFFLSKIKWFRKIQFRRLYIFAWLILFTHILLDAFTSYGTQLLLPFSSKRVGFDSINVVDPIYTIPLLLGLLLSLWIFKRSPDSSKFTKWGLIISSAYLLFTLINKERVNRIFSEKLHEQDISYHSFLSSPVGIANLDWYGVAMSEDSLFIQEYTFTNGISKPFLSFPINDNYLDEIDDEMADRMRWFAKGFYSVEKVNGKTRVYNLQVDMRGIVNDNGHLAPTKGFFEIYENNGKQVFSSGSFD